MVDDRPASRPVPSTLATAAAPAGQLARHNETGGASLLLEPRFSGPCGDVAHDLRSAGELISAHLARCVAEARADLAADGRQPMAQTGDPAEAIVSILLHKDFNHQSRGRVAHLLPEVRRRIAAHVGRGSPVQLVMSYNGGYHATIHPGLSLPLGFEVSTAELMFLYLVARLRQRIREVYAPGVRFHIVLNNGVAHFVNDIPIGRTEGYARQLEAMIAELGGAADVHVLVQSRLGDFADRMRGRDLPVADTIDPVTHRNIERFLGRRCSEAEARLRLGRYAPAEAAWWQELRPIVDAADGLRLLQVASADFLSFRPFPGGATRSQTGQLGFRLQQGRPVPALITTRSFETADVRAVPVRWPLRTAPGSGAAT